jgi:hypothetical protein
MYRVASKLINEGWEKPVAMSEAGIQAETPSSTHGFRRTLPAR